MCVCVVVGEGGGEYGAGSEGGRNWSNNILWYFLRLYLLFCVLNNACLQSNGLNLGHLTIRYEYVLRVKKLLISVPLR